jgi:hypothetical protein
MVLERTAEPSSGFAIPFARGFRSDGTWNDPWFSYGLFFSGGRTFMKASSSTHFILGGTVVINTPYVFTVRYDGSQARAYSGITAFQTSSTTGIIDYSGAGTHDLALGCRSPYSPDEFFTGNVSELIFYGSALSTSSPNSLAVVQDYLKTKYGL